MIEPISYRRVVSIRERINTVGSEPLHVICDDYESYFVKNDKQINPAFSMINEVICHYFLRLWGINTPDICLVNLEKETLSKDFGSRHKSLYYSRPAFGSKTKEGAFDFTEFLQVKGKVDFRKYANPGMFPHLGLFDLWVENEDRPPDLKNLMMFEEEELYHFLAIDQAMAFRTGAYGSLADKAFMPTDGQCILESAYFRQLRRFLKLDSDWCNKERENFYLCIDKCRSHFGDIIKLVPREWGFFDETITILHDCLFDEERNKSVFKEYVRMWQ